MIVDAVDLLVVFVLAVFVGFEVISKVPSILHTPLMSGSNAIHGIILVGSMVIASQAQGALQMTLAFVAVFGLWGATNWTPTLVRALPDLRELPPSEVTSRVSYATMLLNVGATLGYLSFAPLADRLGRRPVFALMCAGSFLMLPITFLTPRSYVHVLLLLPLLGFFNNGIFSGFPIYLPELYPTRIRATGAGFCFNVGRLLASSGPYLTGYLVAALGGFGRAASAVAVIYLVGLLILPFAPETGGKRLPP